MLEILSDGFRVTALFLVVAFGIVFCRFETYSFRKNLMIFFLCAVFTYLLAYWEPIQAQSLIFRVLFYLSISLPIAFWLLAKALFDDDFTWSGRYWILAIGVPIVLNALYLMNEFVKADFYQPFKIVPYLISMGFIIMVIYESVRNRDDDLVLSRLKNRNIFVVFSSFLALFSVYFFFVKDPLKLPTSFELIQNIVISIFIFLFFYSLLEYKNLFESNGKSTVDTKRDPNADIYERIIEKLLVVFEKEQLYTREGMTISQLAGVLNEKEYLVRQSINGKLGYTNFNGFLNHYRITEACRLMNENKSNTFTFQEISYQMGYQSIATFNRAFKNETGKTPSEYMKTV